LDLELIAAPRERVAELRAVLQGESISPPPNQKRSSLLERFQIRDDEGAGS